MAYRLTRRAREDLVDLYVEGVGTYGVDRAEAYHARLAHVFALLADNPHMARERSEIIPPVRVHPCGTHVVIYIVEASGDILVVGVRHAREDWIDDPLGG